MAELVVTFFLFAFVMAVGAIVFAGWVISSIIRLIVRIIAAPFRPRKQRVVRQLVQKQMSIPSGFVPSARCDNRQCNQFNPAGARFCRRCGHSLPRHAGFPASRAALW